MRLLGVVLACIILSPSSIAGDAAGMAVIVHPEQRAEFSLEDIAQIYLRRKRFWDNGATIVPLNLPARAPLRARFSARVLNQTQARLADYWNRQYFQGILPPATLASTEAVRRYVAADPNAIGYVPLSKVNQSVRIVFRLDHR